MPFIVYSEYKGNNMSADKDILKKLAKVIQNQQKIIHKLAQDAGVMPLQTGELVKINVGVVQNIIDSLAGKGVGQVQSASFDNTPARFMSSIKVSNPEKFDAARSNLDIALKRSGVLVGEDGKRYTAKEVSLNTF
jgi:hypothetical protein